MKKFKPIIITCLVIVIVASILVLPAKSAQAAANYPSGWEIIPAECLGSQGKDDKQCGLDSFIQLFVNLSNIGLKILPYLTMVMVIWAGFLLIMAAGNPEKIQEGKKMLTAIVIGVIIITILAWAWSFFVVFVLTGSSKVFPGYKIWERDWWGGGETTQQENPNAGCCIVQKEVSGDIVGHGCIETLRDECTPLADKYESEGKFQGEGSDCTDFTDCDNYQQGCCIPNIANSDHPNCYLPNERGCLDWKITVHNNSQCIDLADCQGKDIIGEGGGNGDGGDWGCCVTDHKCEASSAGACSAGSFKQNKSCDDVDDCSDGCCIGLTQCVDSKINCEGNWVAGSDCASLPGDCTLGCCDMFDDCYSSMQGYCAGVYYAGDCPGVAACTTAGCCVETCQANKVDGACKSLTWVGTGTGCTFQPGCTKGCCLPDNAVTCLPNIYEKNCQDPNDWFSAGACPTFLGGDCETGCCEVDTGCIEGASTRGCNNQGGTPHPNDLCSDVEGCP